MRWHSMNLLKRRGTYLLIHVHLLGERLMAVSAKMRGLNLPVWCLEEVDTENIFNVVQMYIELIQKEGKEAHEKAS